MVKVCQIVSFWMASKIGTKSPDFGNKNIQKAVQWGLEYRTLEYWTIWSLDFQWFLQNILKDRFIDPLNSLNEIQLLSNLQEISIILFTSSNNSYWHFRMRYSIFFNWVFSIILNTFWYYSINPNFGYLVFGSPLHWTLKS